MTYYTRSQGIHWNRFSSAPMTFVESLACIMDGVWDDYRSHHGPLLSYEVVWNGLWDLIQKVGEIR